MTTTTSSTPAPARPVPSLGWVIRRALLGLTVMLLVTGIAAFIAHASIDTPETPVDEIAIGAPAAALLSRAAAAPKDRSR